MRYILMRHEDENKIMRMRILNSSDTFTVDDEEYLKRVDIFFPKLVPVSRKIKELAGDQPLTIAYNDCFRAEYTAKLVQKITGGNLIAGRLGEDYEVGQWMREHENELGLSVIVTHQPVIEGLVGERAGNLDAYLVEKSKYGRGLYDVLEKLSPDAG